MREIKIIIIALLVISAQSVLAQPYDHQPSRANFDYIDILNFSSEVRREIAFAVNKAIDNDKLKVYADKKLTKELTPQEYYDRLIAWENLVIPNPDNPDDIYDLIDTVIPHEAKSENFFYHSNNVYEFRNRGETMFKTVFYVDGRKLEKLLDKKLMAVLNFYKKNGLVDFSCDEKISTKLHESINKRGLTVYSDENLRKELPIEEYNTLIKVGKVKSIQNPDNPEDIYDLIDTTIYHYSYADKFAISGKKVVLENKHGAIFYIKRKQLKKLDKRLFEMVDSCVSNRGVFFSDEKLIAFGKQQVSLLGKTLYAYGLEGKVKAFKDDSVKQVYTKEEIIERTDVKENQAIPNPDNPDDIYDLIDTVITTHFDPNVIDNIRIYFTWETKGFESEAEFIAIAPMFNPVAAGLKLSLTPIFLIKASDYLNTLNKTEKAFWQYFYTYMLQNSSSGGIFEWYTEDNLPNSN